MRWLLALALTIAVTPAAAQVRRAERPARGTEPTPSQRRLIGCFGEAFTLVEHVWRIAPAHLDALSEKAAEPIDRARRDFLAGMVASSLEADQRSALAIIRNLDGCMTEALAQTKPDTVTAVLATAVRTELDSALEDVTDLIGRAKERRQKLQGAIGTAASDRTLDSPLETYLAFGERVKADLLRLRARADALITASTPASAK